MPNTKNLCVLSAILLSAAGLNAGTITDLALTSNGGAYQNDTIANNGTSPLGVTNTGAGLNAPFLNSSDSTVSLSYGAYYLISFYQPYGQIGAGSVSFVLDGSTPYSQDVTFPDPGSASGNFADFSLPGGDSLTISATGLLNDRIEVVGDGGGLSPDGVPDAFYLLTYSQTSSAPEPGSVALVGIGCCALVALKRRSARRS